MSILRNSHSNATTRQLLPAAIEATNLAISKDSVDWHHPSQFPHPVHEWFKGHKDVLFYYGAISSVGIDKKLIDS